MEATHISVAADFPVIQGAAHHVVTDELVAEYRDDADAIDADWRPSAGGVSS
ncbi:MAG: hypothetical protein QM607_05910 [Microbacterium sp.]